MLCVVAPSRSYLPPHYEVHWQLLVSINQLSTLILALQLAEAIASFWDLNFIVSSLENHPSHQNCPFMLYQNGNEVIASESMLNFQSLASEQKLLERCVCMGCGIGESSWTQRTHLAWWLVGLFKIVSRMDHVKTEILTHWFAVGFPCGCSDSLVTSTSPS